MIDYVDFVVFGGREYVRTRATVPAAQVGKQVGAVRCRLVGSAASPSYQPGEGDAAFLPAGTPLFALRDRPVAAALLAARVDGVLRLYSADHADG